MTHALSCLLWPRGAWSLLSSRERKPQWCFKGYGRRVLQQQRAAKESAHPMHPQPGLASGSQASDVGGLGSGIDSHFLQQDKDTSEQFPREKSLKRGRLYLGKPVHWGRVSVKGSWRTGCVVTRDPVWMLTITWGLGRCYPKVPTSLFGCYGVFPAVEKFSLFFYTVSAVIAWKKKVTTKGGFLLSVGKAQAGFADTTCPWRQETDPFLCPMCIFPGCLGNKWERQTKSRI